MPGFIDVSGMTSEQVRRMGHADDDYQAPTQTWTSQVRSLKVGTVDQVWGAACAAQRINGKYVKEAEWMMNATPPYIAKQRSRDVMMDALAVSGTITDEDIAQGQECRRFLQNDLTFRALKGQLSGFDASVKQVLAVTEFFDSAQHRLELAVIASLPQMVIRSQARQALETQIRESAGEFGAIGDKVQLDVTVLGSTYSQTYGIFWVTAVTPDNHVVFFSYKEALASTKQFAIRGVIKAHRNGRTQLNRVKVI